jgi:hypothetical protein
MHPGTAILLTVAAAVIYATITWRTLRSFGRPWHAALLIFLAGAATALLLLTLEVAVGIPAYMQSQKRHLGDILIRDVTSMARAEFCAAWRLPSSYTSLSTSLDFQPSSFPPPCARSLTCCCGSRRRR